MKVVEYQYKPEYLARFPTSEREQMMKRQTGVIAQDLRRILPDAVETAGNVTLPGKGQVDDMLIVNKDRLFLENVGAVRELSKVGQRNKIVRVSFGYSRSVAVLWPSSWSVSASTAGSAQQSESTLSSQEAK